MNQPTPPDLYFIVVDEAVSVRKNPPNSREILGTANDRDGAVRVAMAALTDLGEDRYDTRLAIVGLSRSDPKVWVDGGLVFVGESTVM